MRSSRELQRHHSLLASIVGPFRMSSKPFARYVLQLDWRKRGTELDPGCTICVTRSPFISWSLGTAGVPTSSVSYRFSQPSSGIAKLQTLTGNCLQRQSCWAKPVNGSKSDGGVHDDFSKSCGTT